MQPLRERNPRRALRTVRLARRKAEEMKTTILADYKAKTPTGSSIHVASHSLPLDVNRMIVWMMNFPELALGMVPRWNEIKQDQIVFQEHAEGSAKNHGIQP